VRVWTLGKIWEDLSLEVTADGIGGGRRLWRQEAGPRYNRKAWSESQLTVLMGYLTISTNVRRYQIHHRWQLFLSERQRTGALSVQFVFNEYTIATHGTVKMWGRPSADAHVIWGGTIKRLLIACLLHRLHFCQNIKKIHSRVPNYRKPKVQDVFETRCMCTFWATNG